MSPVMEGFSFITQFYPALERRTHSEFMEKLKKIWGGITSLLVILVVAFALLMCVPRLMGIRPFAILSGSMEPNYPVGSLVFSKPTDASALQPGDPITFMADEDTIVTHRIIEVVPDPEDASVLRFKTQGDANDTADGSLVHYKNVVGKVLFHVPFLGYLSSQIMEPPGLYIALIVVVMFVALSMLFDHWKKEDENEASARETEQKTA